MLPIFVRAPNIGLFCSTCCWKKFLTSGDLPAALQKYSKNEKFSLKNWKKCIFSILGGQNRLPEGWRGLGRLFGLPWGFTPNQYESPRKKFLTRRTPFPSKLSSQKRQFLHFFRQKNQIFEIVAKISDRKCCRNFWQHDGDPLPQKLPETRFQAIPLIIRKVTSF